MITSEKSKQFVLELLTQMKSRNIKTREFMSISKIANLMNIDINKAIQFVMYACKNKYMCKDNVYLPSYVNFPTLFKVWESNL